MEDSKSQSILLHIFAPPPRKSETESLMLGEMRVSTYDISLGDQANDIAAVWRSEFKKEVFFPYIKPTTQESETLFGQSRAWETIKTRNIKDFCYHFLLH